MRHELYLGLEVAEAQPTDKGKWFKVRTEEGICGTGNYIRQLQEVVD